MLEEGDRLPPVIINIVCLGAVDWTERDWRGVPAESPRPLGDAADLGSVGRPADVEIHTPHQLEELSVRRQGQPKGDASRVGETHFQRIDGRKLRLLGVGTLQLVSGRAPIPEVSTEEQLLTLI